MTLLAVSILRLDSTEGSLSLLAAVSSIAHPGTIIKREPNQFKRFKSESFGAELSPIRPETTLLATLFPDRGSFRMKAGSTHHSLDSLCDLVALGKLAAREVSRLAAAANLKEPELRLLRCLQKTSCPLDQKQLANRLALSPAQVCALVEQLSQRELIRRKHATDDRRRSLWEISDRGMELLRGIEDTAESTVASFIALHETETTVGPATTQTPRRHSA